MYKFVFASLKNHNLNQLIKFNILAQNMEIFSWYGLYHSLEAAA